MPAGLGILPPVLIVDAGRTDDDADTSERKDLAIATNPDRAERERIWTPLMIYSFRSRLRDEQPQTWRVVLALVERPDRRVDSFEIADAVGMTSPQVCGHMAAASAVAAELQHLAHKSGTFPWDVLDAREGIRAWLIPAQVADRLRPVA